MSGNFLELVNLVIPDISHCRKILEKVPFLMKKCFLLPEAENIIKDTAGKILQETELFENYSKVLAVFEEGIESYFSGRVKDTLLEEPFPGELCGNIREEIFLLLIAVSCIPAGEKAFIRKDLPVEKLYEALDEYGSWSRNCLRNHGVHG